MKKEYDFSKGERGKFYHPDVKFNFPIDSEPLYRDGRHYDAHHRNFTEDIPFYLRQAQQYGAPVLELACGTGRIAIPIAEAGFEITGLDISEGMLSQAGEKSKGLKLPLKWAYADVRNFRLRKKFNLVIFAFNSIAHLHDLESIDACLQCVRKHLAPDGRFIIDYFNPRLALLIRENKTRHSVTEYPDPYSGNMVEITETNHYDKASQVNHVTWYYKIGEEEFTHQLNMRIFYPRELDALLIHNGFDIETKYGDFDESPFASNSPKQIPVCLVK